MDRNRTKNHNVFGANVLQTRELTEAELKFACGGEDVLRSSVLKKLDDTVAAKISKI